MCEDGVWKVDFEMFYKNNGENNNFNTSGFQLIYWKSNNI